MSAEKREQLIAAGLLNEDGSRKQRCPTCQTAVGEVLTQEAYDQFAAPGGPAVAVVETVAAESQAHGQEPKDDSA